jgi:lipopolysaccharide biosynthesis glycosyltransferase
MMPKIACVSTITNDYVLGLRVFIRSILKNNTWFNYDYILFCEENITEENKKALLTDYARFQFKQINFEEYNNLKFSGNRLWRINPGNRYEIFKIRGYDKIVFFDVDMLCLGDISEVFNTAGDFLACYTPLTDIKKIGFKDGFNCGVMVIDKKFLTQETIDGLKSITQKKKFLGNQAAFNIYFKNYYKLLPQKYFETTPLLTLSSYRNACIIHFCGAIKPWQEKKTKRKRVDPHNNTFWQDHNKLNLYKNYNTNALNFGSTASLYLALCKYKQYLEDIKQEHVK